LALLATPLTDDPFDALRRREVARIAAGTPVDDESLAEAFRTAGTNNDALMHLAARIVAIGDREPERAMRWVTKLPNKGNDIPRRRATEHLFRRWVRRDAQPAAGAALQFWRDGQGHPVSDLLHEWASVAPRDSIAWVRALDDRERTQLAAYEQLLGVLPSVDHRLALELAEVVPERYGSALIGAYSQILPALVATDVEAALAAYARYEARAPANAARCVAAMVRAWSAREPQKAVAFAESKLTPDDPGRYLALHGIATTWATKDPRAAANLSLRAVLEQRQNRAFDHDDNHHRPRQDPLADIVTGWAKAKRSAAVAWVEKIEEADLREHLQQVLGVQRPKTAPPPKPQPSRDIGKASTPSAIKYGLIDYYPDFFYCDPDMWPVHDSAGEQSRALAALPSIAADAAHYAAVLERLGATQQPNPGPEQKLKVYREHKKLEAVKLESTPTGYRYELNLSNAVVQGNVEQATITETNRRRQFNSCPRCLAATTRIATPTGAVPVTQLRAGSLVWTRNAAGARVAAPVLRLASTPAPRDHVMILLVLSDGRTVAASPNHPLADGRSMGNLRAGHEVDGAVITSVTFVAYDSSATYDVLPAGDTGVYWADGVPLATTLVER
ncbi:MAG TPA: hypothetical protein VLC93_20285, partial [Myxococcota bacterium]|nr:hypothetical protein [Myxococcota bacterium]